jgi:hypothetical protein
MGVECQKMQFMFFAPLFHKDNKTWDAKILKDYCFLRSLHAYQLSVEVWEGWVEKCPYLW